MKPKVVKKFFCMLLKLILCQTFKIPKVCVYVRIMNGSGSRTNPIGVVERM